MFNSNNCQGEVYWIQTYKHPDIQSIYIDRYTAFKSESDNLEIKSHWKLLLYYLYLILLKGLTAAMYGTWTENVLLCWIFNFNDV